jgi:hypothetical protein
LSLGLIAGRSILSVEYPILVGRILKIKLSSQLKGTLRPTLVMAFYFILVSEISRFIPVGPWSGIIGWVGFFLSAGISFGIVLIMAFFSGLNGHQRKRVVKRFQRLFSFL